MTDVSLEIFRAIIVFIILISLFRGFRSAEIRNVGGWRCLVLGFALVFLGTLVDITDNFSMLGKYIIIGDTQVQAVLEKVVGYLLGFTLIAIGVSRWLPKISEHQLLIKENLKRVEKENQALRGIVPICCYCNDIRDDEGNWEKLELYIEKRSEASFSHSICEVCIEKHFLNE